MKARPNILAIAGFDPSSGAGFTADIKTIEALKGYGLAVCTANTVQNDMQFKTCHWMPLDVIKSQIETLFERFAIDTAKIGIVEDWDMLNEIIDFLLEKNKRIKIILDPILSASAAYDFHDKSEFANTTDENAKHPFDQILDKIYLLTPNYNEIQQLYPDKTIDETIAHISNKTHLFLKGGHRQDKKGKDELFTKTGKHFSLNPKSKISTEKHGSGCVLSSAIATYIAFGFPLLKACFRGKKYTESVLGSNKTLLGYHKV